MRQIVLVVIIVFVIALSGCSSNSAEELFDTAKLEELQSNPEHASKLYQEIIDKYPDSEFAGKAKERIISDYLKPT